MVWFSSTANAVTAFGTRAQIMAILRNFYDMSFAECDYSRLYQVCA